MDNCFLIVNKIAKNKAKDHISLSYDERFLRRKKLVSDNGFEFLVNLPETKSLSENQAFRLQSGNLILIKNKKENLLEVLRPFKPEGGAYGIGRTHSHKH